MPIYPLYGEKAIKVIQRAHLFHPRENFEDIFDDLIKSHCVFAVQEGWEFSEDKANVKVMVRIWSLATSAAYSSSSIVSMSTWIRELALALSATILTLKLRLCLHHHLD